jgi:hypothetical protein
MINILADVNQVGLKYSLLREIKISEFVTIARIFMELILNC